MRWLNYHHLYYFLTVVQKGSVTAAARHLRLAQPTISAQLKALEDSLGHKLLEKKGRYLQLTEIGRHVHGYAEEIFSLGSELFKLVDGIAIPEGQPLRIGVVDSLPKHVAYRIIDPIFSTKPTPRVVHYEDTSEKLLAMLSIQEIDLVLSDSPIPPNVKIKAYNHLLGETGISFLGNPKLVTKYTSGFPFSLHDAPLLLPTPNSVLRRELDTWFQHKGIQPNIVGEFQDSAIMKIFAKSGRGLIPVPSVVEKDILNEYDLKVLGRVSEIRERFFLISAERRLKHPAVVTLNAQAHQSLFQQHRKTHR